MGSNNAGTSTFQMGKDRLMSGKTYIDLHSKQNEGYVGRFISGVNNDASKSAYTSLMHNGAGNFSIRMWNNSSKMVFQNPKGSWLTIEPNGTLIAGGTAKKPGGGEWVTTSDKRTKRNINEYEGGLAEVLKLNPVTYNYNGKAGISDTEKEHIGLIAQEFAKVAPYAVESFNYAEEGSNKTEEYLAIDASSVKYMVVNAIKEQQALIEAQRAELEALKTEMAKMKSNGTSITPTVNEMSVLLEGSGAESALLAQNSPNPFITKTRIEYFIPQNSKHCRIAFKDMNGKEIKMIEINHEGVGAIDLSAKDLAAGIYSYVLYVNGDIVASKKMILRQ